LHNFPGKDPRTPHLQERGGLGSRGEGRGGQGRAGEGGEIGEGSAGRTNKKSLSFDISD